MAHPNEDLVRKGYEAFAKGDLDTLRDLLAEDIVWHFPGRSPVSGDFRGHDEVFEYFGKLVELTSGTFSLDIHDLLADDEHAVVLAVATATSGEKRLEDRAVNVLHLKDGKVTEFWAHPGDQYAVDEFWS